MYRIMNVLSVWAILLAVTVSPTVAMAEDAAASYKTGVKAFKKGRYLEAVKAFRAANKAKPSWKLYFNIGQSEAAAKRHGLALSALEVYLSEGGDDIPSDRRDEVLAEVERLRKMVGRVAVEAPEGAIVYMDDVKRGTAPILGKIPVAASVNHEIWAVLKGKELKRRLFRVSGGDTVAIKFETPKATANPGPSQTSPETAPSDAVPTETGQTEGTQDILTKDTSASSTKKRSKLSVAGWVLTGTGAAMLVAGAVTGGLALHENGELAKDCVGTSCPSSRDQDINRLNTLTGVTNVLLGVGAAAAVTGAILLIVAAKKEKKTHGEPGITPVLGPSYGGLAIEGRF